MQEITDFLSKTDEWKLYNSFFLMNDIERLRKFMVREHFFKMSLELPGDIVEVGVFKGTGIAQLLKMREILIPASNKKVIGFDLFSSSNDFKQTLNEKDSELDVYYNKCNVNMTDGIKKEDIENLINKMKLTNTNTDNIYKLVEGDVSISIPKYLNDNPGFRISFLYLDLDIDEPTYVSLNLLHFNNIQNKQINLRAFIHLN
jgi:hypothetical protein